MRSHCRQRHNPHSGRRRQHRRPRRLRQMFAPAAPPPWPEAAKLPDVPPTFEPTPALAERQQSVDAIDPAPTPASDPAEESQSPAYARSSPASAPAKATGDADHTLALAMIGLAVLAISGTMFHATRWLSRRRASNRWPHPSTLNTPYPHARTPLDFDSGTPAQHIPLPKPLDQTERLAQALQQLLHELQTKHCLLPPGPSTLSRSSSAAGRHRNPIRPHQHQSIVKQHEVTATGSGGRTNRPNRPSQLPRMYLAG